MNTTHTRKPRHTSFRGVFAAMATPMKPNEDVDYEKLAAFSEYLIDQGLHGLIPLGSTGEYYALDHAERERVLRVVVEAARGRVPVLAGTNAGSTRDVVAFSRQAEELGCDGVMLAPPYYSLPQPDELFEHFRAVNNAIGIPIMLYNYPGRTGVDMSPEFIERLAGLKNVRYVKESTGEMARITELIRRCGDRIGVFCGCDTIALESLMVGAIGWVGGVANVLPKVHVRIYELVVREKNFAAAKRLFYQALPTLELMEGAGKYTQFVKAGCRLMGHDLGAPRRPLRRVTPAECRRLRSVLKLSGSTPRF
ncbi:MAG TPA: 4-hydroxy-tetrahydrodipicolinate synthase [Verrucomicrobia bacterium]|nr:4-hydroxy-tetrahydrodipicolinate synthase [Verrucomicrobiota bacterium]HOB31473.1 4-hydroxy-tetrahydrodipicolinate synthase [Verrucomicrobiota bacterium]HOP96523.1 4-hydroxy-tetrahydrodipicolinate synthase [Verrucomicrobiota bacterium]